MKAPPAAARPSGFPGFGWGYAVLVVAAVFAAYAPALRSGFIWDDDAHVTAAALRSWRGLAQIWVHLGATQQYYPLLHSAFWLEHRMWGDSPIGYHAVNLLLHATAALLFAMVLRRLEAPGALWAGLIFAVHPVGVESAVWISEQKNTLSLVFYLASAAIYLRFDRTRSPKAYGAALALFVAALLSKSVTATLPAALLVVLWWRRGALSARRDAAPLIPWLVVGLGSGLFTAWVERHFIGAAGADFALSFGRRCLLAGRIVWFYLGKLVWPTKLAFIYPRWNAAGAPVHWVLFPLAAVAMTAGFWALRTRVRGPLAGWLFFVGSLSPALGFINVYPFIFSYVADHFQYGASLGPIALAGAGAHWLEAQTRGAARRVIGAIFGGVIVGLAVLSYRQSKIYHDAATLYTATLEQNPDAWLAHLNLGNELWQQGKAVEAVDHYRRAETLEPDYPFTHFNLAKLWLEQGNLAGAIAENREALRLVPTDAEARNNLGIALAESGQPDQAEAQFLEAIRLRPNYARAHGNLGSLYLGERRFREAAAQEEEALRWDPTLQPARENLAAARRNLP